MPRALLIDAGNTRTKWMTPGAKREPAHVETGEVTLAWLQSLAERYPKVPVVVACVVPRLVPLLRRAFASRLHLVTTELALLGGLRFNYPRPAELGADRLATALAAHARKRFPALIISCGTATAFSLLNARGVFCGGAIAPGLETQLTALIARTGQLPATLLREPRRPLGRSTVEAIRAGVMLSFVGGVKEIVRELTADLGQQPHLLVTGGQAQSLKKRLGPAARFEPLLVFEGLRIMADRLP